MSVEEAKQNAPLKIRVQKMQTDYIEDKSVPEQN
jgi:hypothetical protein